MANPTIFSYSLLDRVGLVADTPLYAAYNGAVVTVDSLIGRWLEMGALFDDTTTSQIVGGHILIPLNPDVSWKSAPGATGNKNNEVAVLNFENAANQYLTEVLIPGYLDSFLVNGKINLAAAEIAALVAEIIDTSTPTDFQSRDLEQLTGVRNGFLTTRRRKGQTSKTRAIG